MVNDFTRSTVVRGKGGCNIARYRYLAKNMQGTTASGTLEASNRREVYRLLKERDYYPIKVEKVIQVRDIKDLKISSKINSRDLAVLCKQFSTMLKAGIPIVKCLDILSKQLSNRLLRSVFAEMYTEVRSGRSLSESLAGRGKYFPQLFTSMVEAGEASGTLDEVLGNLAQHYEKEHKLIQKVKNSMTYPVIVLVVAVAVVYFLLTVVVPTFVSIFSRSGAMLPLPTRMLLYLSDFMLKYGIFVLLFLIMLAFGFYLATSRGEGRYKWHKLLLRLPMVKTVVVQSISTRFSGTLGILLRTGIPLVTALEIVKKVVGNEVAQRGLQYVQETARKGGGISAPLEQLNLFPPMLIQMVRIGEESGTLDEMLLKTAEFYEGELETNLTRLTTLLEPMVIVLLGGIVAFIVLSIALPMFEMTSFVG
ncbi:type IV pilus assembly protein PilC [Caldicoprobacter guelmensis]|uniref:type II secretion system F family protein n=1 Tax=Caldicoprobacter guelmensis TaxID=1170224 RepID=UPI00195BA70B|nr:type II secretion system F family protein [Caldicoprobacter guelmensis]MBM7581265.1 type IV pilus assembly protein PilC [Caldicoprobacter guelmensis]